MGDWEDVFCGVIAGFFFRGGKEEDASRKKRSGKESDDDALIFFISRSRRLFHLIIFKPERHKDPLARKSSRRERERKV